MALEEGKLFEPGMQGDNCFLSPVRPCPFGATKLHVLLSDFDIRAHLLAVNGQKSNLTLAWELSSARWRNQAGNLAEDYTKVHKSYMYGVVRIISSFEL